MITRKSFSQPLHRRLLTPKPTLSRHLHARSHPPPTPPPTPFVPDPPTFLTLIGRDLTRHTAKFPTWHSLFSLTGPQLRELGVEPARTRRYLLWWRDRFRKGLFGPGGDLRFVRDGEAEVRVVEVPVRGSGEREGSGGLVPLMRKVVVNEPVGGGGEEGVKPVEGMRVKGVRTIAGPYVSLVKGTGGSVGRIRVQEGMWEVRRGVKVDGGERRKVQVRRKRLLEERKTSRK